MICLTGKKEARCRTSLLMLCHGSTAMKNHKGTETTVYSFSKWAFYITPVLNLKRGCCARTKARTLTKQTSMRFNHIQITVTSSSQSHSDIALAKPRPAGPLSIFNKHQWDKRHPGAANKRNVAIKMANSCSERLRGVPQGWLHLGGARMMLMPCLFDSDGALKKEAYVRYQR